MLLEVKSLLNGSPDSFYLTQEKFNLAVEALDIDYKIVAGVNEHRLKLKPSQDFVETDKLLLPDKIYRQLSLPQTVKLSANIDEWNNSVKIGPFLGILTVRNKKSRRTPFSSQRGMFEVLIRAGFKRGIVPFVFNPEGIDWENRSLTGYTLQINSSGETQWVRDLFPFPDVVYNRILNRSVERWEVVSETVRRLESIPNLKHFNPRFLNKWETHQILSQNPDLQEYLPETIMVSRLQDIANLSAKYPVVYVKPINGSLGSNIVKLQAVEKGYRYQYRRRRRNITGTWPDAQTMGPALSRIIGNRKYIVQQGLEFQTYQNRVLDIRLLVQKDGTGCWTTAAIVARVAAAGSAFPNIAAGGVARPIEEIWQELYQESWHRSPVRRKIVELGQQVPVTLEKKLGNFAELGLDIGIDTDKNPWLIEVNSKPSRKVFPKEDPSLKLQSIINIIEYSKYLAGYPVLANDAGAHNGTPVHDN